MATDPNAIRAAQAGKTVITTDGYEVTYDDTGFARKSVAPDGSVKYYDSLGNQTSTVWSGDTAQSQQTGDAPASYTSNPDSFVGPAQQLTDQGIPAGYEMGVAYDEQGNLLPGWAQDPSGQFAVQVEPGYVDPATRAQANSDRQSYQNTQAFDSNGQLNPGWTYDEFGTPVQSSGESSQQKTVTSETTQQDHGTSRDDEGNLMPGWAYSDELGDYWVGGSYVDQKTVDSAAETRAANSASHGAPYDDEGNLMPGWSLNEDGDPVWVGGDFVEPATAASAKASREAAASNKTGSTNDATKSAAAGANKAAVEPDDWRVRLSLAPNANYLYNVAKAGDILFPLTTTNGVLFPYTPQIQTSYRANYDPGEVTHSNYKYFFYKNSSVDDITITADFTAQDTSEANYLLAVIHFFKSATKMFYGQDQSPRAGTPPPLLYLSGFGAYQFDKHPLLLTNFTYNLPNDVDYIRAGSTKTWGGTNIAQEGKNKINSAATTPLSRLKAAFGDKVKPGGAPAEPAFANLATVDSTYVPTKIQIQLSFSPAVTRKDISDNFSLGKYATGSLSRGSKRPTGGGGIW